MADQSIELRKLKNKIWLKSPRIVGDGRTTPQSCHPSTQESGLEEEYFD